ncbi:Rid family hydrolase [Alkalihalobacterium chitinilyticum]|uniref:Rid family hydrolase n=1 Tax=Alkalihalobacterium chitinilyticum TaxID=2980103 RepID=A0ABT5VFZ4_9BACI|nr:Rid family hydrolase [Alkalihalobacterium chitinilyticum]MDE5414380.1 Rid family hydrolase [Alkalihalobacterium chitinilyticum]
MMKKLSKKIVASAIVGTSLLAGVTFTAANGDMAKLIRGNDVVFFGSPTSSISSSVAIPHNYNKLYFSGTVPVVKDRNGSTIYERYGNTEEQAITILERFKQDLEGKGLSMSDITYLRVYVVPDPEHPENPGEIDYQGWFNAYAKYFNTEENPVKTARSTVGVEGLVNSDWLIEIEAEVAYKSINPGKGK